MDRETLMEMFAEIGFQYSWQQFLDARIGLTFEHLVRHRILNMEIRNEFSPFVGGIVAYYLEICAARGVLPMVVSVSYDAFDSIFTKLVAGEPAYLYDNFCPHENDACQCPKRTCFLDEGLVYGTRDGVIALIVPKSTVQVGRVRVMRPKSRKGKKGRGRQ
jgi:hypothetical protein